MADPDVVFAPYLRRGWDRGVIDLLRAELGIAPVASPEEQP